jgi:hypothetical protein
MGGTVKMRAEANAFVCHLAPRRQTEDLVPAAIGEHGPRPTHERVEPATSSNQVIARPKMEVVRVAEDDRGTNVVEITRRHRFHSALGPNGHEHRRLDDTVRCLQLSSTGQAITMRDVESHGAVLLLSQV